MTAADFDGTTVLRFLPIAGARSAPSASSRTLDEIVSENRHLAFSASAFYGSWLLSLTGEPKPLASNIACLDYSVAKDGHLCVYRWSGEQKLSPANFVTVAG